MEQDPTLEHEGISQADLDRVQEIIRLRVVNTKLLAALEASEAYEARIHSSSPPWDDCPNGVCFWCSDCVHRVINMRRAAIQEAKK